jgi:hypothetical protein
MRFTARLAKKIDLVQINLVELLKRKLKNFTPLFVSGLPFNI